MSQFEEMLDPESGSGLVVDDDRTDGLGELAADDEGRDAALLKVSQRGDIDEKPVRDDDEGLDATLEQHFERSFESSRIIMCIGEDGDVIRLVEGALDSAQDRRAERVRNIEHHHTDGVISLAAKRSRQLIGPVAEFARNILDALLGGGTDVASKRGVVENDGNGARGKARLLGNVADGDRRVASTFAHIRLVAPLHTSQSQFATKVVVALFGKLRLCC